MKVANNIELLKVGMKIYYIDADNFQKWTITEIDETGFEAYDQDGVEDYFEFDSLQLCWEF